MCIDVSDHARKGREFCTVPPKEWKQGWPLMECQLQDEKIKDGPVACAYGVSVQFADGGQWDGVLIAIRDKCTGAFVPSRLVLSPTNEKSQAGKRGGEAASL